MSISHKIILKNRSGERLINSQTKDDPCRPTQAIVVLLGNILRRHVELIIMYLLNSLFS
jgi:hypothetical protein